MDNLITISKHKLNSILNKHEMWLLNDPRGKRADLRWADLSGAKLDWPLACQEKGSFIGYKKCRNNLIVELEIPEDAYRCSATSKKCRCSKAKVLSITNLDGSESKNGVAVSEYDSSFVYRIGGNCRDYRL